MPLVEMEYWLDRKNARKKCVYVFVIHNPLLMSLNVVGIKAGLKRYRIDEIREKIMD